MWGILNLPGLVMFALYAAGIASALGVSFVIRRLFWRGTAEPFLMELPTYKLPDPANVARNVILRGRIFLTRAGTIILPMMVVVWALSSFPGAPAGATDPAINYSIAGMLGHLLQPIFQPIGFNWQMTVALIPGFAAREVAVAALGTVYAIGGADPAAGAWARPWPSTGRSPPGCRSWPGTSSRRSAPRRWGS